ncbi:uncharacterized protein LOC109515414 isoform X2 [Hippocampus comes]|uniref:uncharacterized protein LOC109515414 isoform X2 n=1 Tax=Hippocampus comes TaxID=109280 RepID=UPI00094EB053|nr:PREDICTED: uncharacterized protein LOC109515414 isoform X2 [Hippocampus comes]
MDGEEKYLTLHANRAKDYTIIKNNVTSFGVHHCGNAAIESLVDSTESKLSDLCDDSIKHPRLHEETPSGEGKVSDLTVPSWREEGIERPKIRNKMAELELHHADHNQLGLRDLHCSDDCENETAKVWTETEKALAAAELSHIVREERSPLKEEAKHRTNSLAEDGEGVRVNHDNKSNRLECQRYSQSGELLVWPDENDQWAAPEKRCSDNELRSELFPGFRTEAWEVAERLVVGREFWEAEENDELAGSEPHPGVLVTCEESWNDERQALTENPSGKENVHREVEQEATDVQQVENWENLVGIHRLNALGKISDEVENKEIPDQENSEKGENKHKSLSMGMIGDGRLAGPEENQNFNIWPQRQLRELQEKEPPPSPAAAQKVDNNAVSVNCFSRPLESQHAKVTICETEGPQENYSDQENLDSDLYCQAERGRSHHAEHPTEDSVSTPKGEEDFADVADPQVDNFSSVDFPSPPPSIDLDMQDDKMESLDDSFPSPPPSVSETEELSSPPNFEDLNPEAEFPQTSFTKTPLQDLAAIQNKGTVANQNPPSEHTKQDTERDSSETQGQNDAHPSPAPVNHLPELFISEWKDMDEEALEDFEKLEQLCCISGDEEGTLGDIFLENLELLECLKKTPDQKGAASSLCDAEDAEEASRSPGQTADAKDQSSLSKMTTKNGLMMQVCEERLQFSLSENVKTNVLWGATVKDTVTLRPWGEKTSESKSEATAVQDQNQDNSQTEQESCAEPNVESEKTESGPLTVIEQPEVTTLQSSANQTIKAKVARLSLALPPLALTLPLNPTGKGGFGDGAIGSRIGRRRGLLPGNDPEEEEEDEAEDESSRRVIVVTETDVDKRVGLRSLLKSPKEPLDRERDRGRNVSFFDDVTIYLFDQETPTNALSSSAPTSPAAASVKNTLHGSSSKNKDFKRKEARAPVGGANAVTSSRFTVSPAKDPHLA